MAQTIQTRAKTAVTATATTTVMAMVTVTVTVTVTATATAMAMVTVMVTVTAMATAAPCSRTISTLSEIENTLMEFSSELRYYRDIFLTHIHSIYLLWGVVWDEM